VRSLPLALLRGSPCILNLFCLFWIGYFQDRTMTAAIGLSMCCYMFFNNVLVLINGDCAGVWCSKYFAKNQDLDARLANMRGYGVTVIILVVSMCGFYPRLDLILQWIGYPKELSEMTHLAV
jgi:Na+-driven multidrug efflux pump